MFKRLLVILAATLMVASVQAAETPDLQTIIKQSKESFEPARPCMKKLTITMSSSPVQIVAGVASKSFPDGKRIAMVIFEPKDLEGFAFLVNERKNKADLMWVYVPYLQRVKEMKPVQQDESFLGTDFSFAELGFVKINEQLSSFNEEKHAGVQAYKVAEKVQRERSDYVYSDYSKITTWISEETWLPLQRDFYDPEGNLWKSEIFEDASMIEGVPTPVHILMKDLIYGTSTDMRITDVDYDVTLPDKLFEAGTLDKAAKLPLWQPFRSHSAKEK